MFTGRLVNAFVIRLEANKTVCLTKDSPMCIKMIVLSVFAIAMVSCSKVQNDATNQIVSQEPNGVYPFVVVDKGQVGSIHIQANAKFDPEMEAAFNRICQFECSAVAYSKLGSPVLQSKLVPGGLKLENVFDYDANANLIVQYLVWRNSETYYCFGFDELGQVISKDVGIKNQ
jgi:hypothetical protein